MSLANMSILANMLYYSGNFGLRNNLGRKNVQTFGKQKRLKRRDFREFRRSNSNNRRNRSHWPSKDMKHWRSNSGKAK